MAAALFATAIAADPPQQAAAANISDDNCLQKEFHTDRANAKRRAAVCSTAIQSHKLTVGELVIARLNRADARMALGDKVMASVDYEEALEHYDSVLDPNAPDALALYRRGAAFHALGQTDRALSDYDEAIRLDPKFPFAYLGRGILLATRKRDYGRAIEDFDKVLNLTPDDVDALIKRGDAYGQMGEFGRALADLDRAIVLAPDDAQAYVFRGLANSRRKNNQLAKVDYSAALKIDPRNVDALVNRAAVYAIDNENDLALRDLDAAIAIQNNDPLAFYNRGYVHFVRRDYDLAIADYSSAIDLDSNMGLAYNNRCLTRAITGIDLVPALADCDVALKTMPTDLDVRVTRGFIYLKLGDPAIAIVEYNAALGVDPNRALALYGRGMAQIRMDHKKEGEADKAAARALNPSVELQFSMYGLN